MNEHLFDGAVFLIFGATGDLAKRKLYPALYSLYREGKLTDRFAVVGLARRARTQEVFRQDVYESIKQFARYPIEQAQHWERFADHFEYMSLDIHNVEDFKQLKKSMDQLDQNFGIPGNRLYYLALSPELFGPVSHHIRAGGLLDSRGWHRLLIEKPFGYSFETAEILNREIRDVFEEDQIYRIDHYLGKEMVQNIEVIRFANAFFEPLWNHKYIANIQMTLSETVGVEDRGGYYDKYGALRDMGQNHMLQMITMMAMEPPSRLVPEDIRDEKVKVLRALRMYSSNEEVRKHVIRGQYEAGSIHGNDVAAYRAEDSVAVDSTTETFFAAKVFVDNFRWAGVPFYIRTGKRLPAKTTEVIVEFKSVPEGVYFASKNELSPNLLVFRVHPDEGIYIKINAKKPDADWAIIPVAMDFFQSHEVGLNTPEAYERLLFAAAKGDSTHFTRWDEVALAWKFVDRIAEAWKEDGHDLFFYNAGTWGPSEAGQLLDRDGFKWWPVHGQDVGNTIWVTNRGKQEGSE